MAKRILTFVLVGLMVFLSVPFVQAEGAGNYKIDWLVEKNYVQGRDGGKLDLEKTITRAEFTKMVLVATGELEFAKAFSVEGIFTDVPADHWAAAIINYASQKGYIKGHLDGTFHPDDNITFEEAITILTRLNKEFVEPDYASEYWAQPYIDFANQVGILADVKISSYKDDVIRQYAFEMVYNEIEVKESFARAEEAKKEAEKKAEEAKKEADKKAEEAKKEADKKDQEKKNDQAKKDRDDDYYNPPYWPGNDYWDGPTYDPEVNPSPTPTPEPGPSPEEKQAEAETAVADLEKEDAEVTDEAIKDAQDKIDNVQDGSKKAELQAKLDAIKTAKEEADKKKAEEAADEAVNALESKKIEEVTSDDINAAQAKVDKVADTAKREALQNKLNDLKEAKKEADEKKAEEERKAQEAAAQTAADEVLKALEEKNGNVTDDDIANAEKAIEKVTDEGKKQNLKNRLDAVKEAKEEADKKKVVEAAAEKAVADLEKADAEVTDELIKNAQDKIDNVQDATKKAELQAKLDAIKTAKEEADKKRAKEEAAAQSEAQEAVKALEDKKGDVTDQEIQDAKEKVGKVTNPEKKQELQTKLEAVEAAKAEFDKKKAAEAAADDALKDLEDKKGDVTDEQIKNAEEAINKVTDDAKKQDLKNRLNAVKTAKEEADKKKAEEEAAAQAEAEEAVNTLEEKNGNVTDKEIQDAKEKIGKVTNPVKKQELESKLNKVEEAKAEFDKKKAAEAAAETAVADLEKPDAEVTDELIKNAQDKIDSVQDGNKKAELQAKLDAIKTAKEEADKKKAEEEAAAQEAAEDALKALEEKSDEEVTDQDLADAKEKIDAVTDPDKKKDFLRRYNTSKAGKEAADQRKAEEEKKAKEAAAQAEAEAAVEALEDKEGDVTDQDITNAKEAIEKVTDTTRKQELNDRLEKVEKAKKAADEKKAEEEKKALEEENAFLDKISDFSFGKDEFDYAKMFFDKDSTRDESFVTGKGFNHTAFREEFLRLVNEERARQGLNALTLDESLEKGTDIRSKELAEWGHIRVGENLDQKHKRLNGDSFRTAFDYLPGYDYDGARYLGENLLCNTMLPEKYDYELTTDDGPINCNEYLKDYKKIAEDMFKMWKDSPGHYGNMMGEHYKTMWVSAWIAEESSKLGQDDEEKMDLLVGVNIFSTKDQTVKENTNPDADAGAESQEDSKEPITPVENSVGSTEETLRPAA